MSKIKSSKIEYKPKTFLDWCLLIIGLALLLFFVVIIFGEGKPNQDIEKEVKRLRANGINLEKQGDCYRNWDAICENSIASCPGRVNNYYLKNKNITIEDYTQSINAECNLSGSKDFVAIIDEDYKKQFNETSYNICFRRCYND